MSACTGITASIMLDCNNPPVAGTVDRLILINKDEILSVTYAGVGQAPPPPYANQPHRVVTGITMATNTVTSAAFTGFEIEGRNNSIEPSYALRKGRYFDSYEHTVAFKIFTNGPDAKEQIERMVQKGNLVAIVENNYRGANGEAAFEIFGLDSGLEVSEGSRTATDTDTQGAHSIALKTSEQQGEPHLPLTLYITDYATSKVIVDGLLPV